MAVGKSDYLENAILDHVLGGGDYERAATVYVALHSADPGDDATGSELSGNGYARAAVVNNSTNWPAAGGGEKSNGVAIAFPTATDAWAEATHFGVWDAATEGNLLYYGPLETARTVTSGTIASFAVGALTIEED